MSKDEVDGNIMARVFDTCINSRISRSLENRAFFIKKMSNLPLLILRNIG